MNHHVCTKITHLTAIISLVGCTVEQTIYEWAESFTCGMPKCPEKLTLRSQTSSTVSALFIINITCKIHRDASVDSSAPVCCAWSSCEHAVSYMLSQFPCMLWLFFKSLSFAVAASVIRSQGLTWVRTTQSCAAVLAFAHKSANKSQEVSYSHTHKESPTQACTSTASKIRCVLFHLLYNTFPTIIWWINDRRLFSREQVISIVNNVLNKHSNCHSTKREHPVVLRHALDFQCERTPIRQNVAWSEM